MRIEYMLKKSLRTIQNEGVSSFLRKSYNVSKRKLLRVKLVSNYAFKDILFINGCTLPHPPRYRIDHQIEQLHFNGYSCDTIYYEDLKLEMLSYYRAFVFFRCPHTDLIEQFIKKARYFNKTTFFDIDDLVIDYKFVKEIKHLKTMNKDDYEQYMDGVQRTNKTLSLCDYAITTTGRLAKELSPYVKEVFINRNTASDKMVELSELALKKKEETKGKEETGQEDKVVLGYFSGSITHNEDFDLILETLVKIFKQFDHVYLKVVGILDIPKELEPYKDRLIIEKFTNWYNLPEIIASVDINLAPLVNTVFNEAKSENKWMEAALVKVPTIASNVGAFNEVIDNHYNGVLCENTQEWEHNLSKLITDQQYRDFVAANAYKIVKNKWITARTGYNLCEFIEERLSENIAFVLPSTQISGGVNVVIKHCNILRDEGKDVLIVSMSDDDDNIVNTDGEINVISYHKHSFHGFIRKCVATLWSTNQFLNTYPKIKEKYYLVQNYETDFYQPGNFDKILANLTYNSFSDLRYITISKWCERWLREEFRKEVKFCRNGIDLNLFKYKDRLPYQNRKIRILVEGNSADYYKNVDESFHIVNELDKDKFEVWYLSYNGKPKDWYRVDKFFNKVPYDEVARIYSECDILIKSSLLESFSYPPLEMMATGGIAIVAPNEGNTEYLEHEKNCMLYKQGDTKSAVQMISQVCVDEKLRKKLIENGLKTAEERSWGLLYHEVLELYGFDSRIKENKEDYYEIQSC